MSKSILKVFKEHNVEFTIVDGVKYVETRSIAMALGVVKTDRKQLRVDTYRWGNLLAHAGVQQVTRNFEYFSQC